MPQDIRERKGAFFTPRRWVELSQAYLADALGEAWQEEYYIWDCAAGTGNLLAGLTNKYRIFASTLDMADVRVMEERAAHGANLLPAHLFQFDFLNDEFKPQSAGGKLPDTLYEVISAPERRKRLVIYINPPYAEHGNTKQIHGTGKNKDGVKNTKVYDTYQALIGPAARELFAQFLIRIYCELEGCVIANFSKLKILQAANFKVFRSVFTPALHSLFLVPANTFDNVQGQFPIGFFIWNCNETKTFAGTTADVYGTESNYLGSKYVYSYDSSRLIIEWLRNYFDKQHPPIGYLRLKNTSIQSRNEICITSLPSQSDFKAKTYTYITPHNVIVVAIYCVVRYVVEGTWINDRDQFLFPNGPWELDRGFMTNCLVYALFSNRIKSADGPNHWIPFTEEEVDAQEAFECHFMTDFMAGKIKPEAPQGQLAIAAPGIRSASLIPSEPMVFSAEARAVFDAGRALWRYYHAQRGANPNASYYDIREHFQGRDARGRMNPKSHDAQYSELLAALREAVRALGDKIAPKVYEYGFLKE